MIRELLPKDEEAVAVLHREVFPEYRSSWLGHGFCVAMFRSYRLRADCVVLVSEDDAGIRGYLVACPPATQHLVASRLKGRAGMAAARVLLTRKGRGRARSMNLLARSRRVVTSVSRKASSPPRHGVQMPMASAAPAAGKELIRVVLIGVAPQARGGGIADQLLEAFRRRAKDQGFTDAELVVARENGAARRCYDRNGWSVRDSDPASASLRYVLVL